MSKSIGRLVEDAVRDYGINMPVLEISGDSGERVVWIVTAILDSDGRPCLAYPDGEEVTLAGCLWEVDMDSINPKGEFR